MGDRLTDKMIKKLPVPNRGNRVTYDDIVKGFGCRVTAAGSRSFVVNYRRKADGLERRYTIGSFPEWTVAGARQEAKRLKREIDGGADPVGEARSEREAPTVADLIDRYMDEQLPRRRPSTQRDYRSMLTAHIRPALGKRKVASLTYEEIDALHRKVTKESGPYRGNRVIALVSKLCSLAMQWHMRRDNPCRGIERNIELKRKRYLSDVEIIRLAHALDEHLDQEAADMFRLLLMTGARRGEVLAMRWADVDLQRGVWSKPASSTKQAEDHVVPLHPQAIRLLAARKNSAEFVFPGRATKHRVDVKKNWAAITRMAGLHGLRIHDLRHSFASILASAGVGLHTIGQLLGHSEPRTTHRYAHLVDAHLRQAIEHVKLPEAKQ
jgi:integrase